MEKSILTTRKEQKDVFHAFLVKNANYAGNEEIPHVKTSNLLPEKVISFSKAVTSKEYDSWIHFYEHDYKFEKLWNNPQKYLPIVKKFKGIISPDFSLYYDMPLVMQKWNTYRGKALASYFYEKGVEIIPNVRWGDERTFELATLGVEKNKTIAVGTHGCIKTIEEKLMFIRGFDYVVQALKPENIVVYGRLPDKIFCLAKMYGINLIHFESEFAAAHKKGGGVMGAGYHGGFGKTYGELQKNKQLDLPINKVGDVRYNERKTKGYLLNLNHPNKKEV